MNSGSDADLSNLQAAILPTPWVWLLAIILPWISHCFRGGITFPTDRYIITHCCSIRPVTYVPFHLHHLIFKRLAIIQDDPEISGLPLLDRHHRLGIVHTQTIRVCMVLVLLLLLEYVAYATLRLRNGAVFVLDEHPLQMDDLLSKLVHLGR